MPFPKSRTEGRIGGAGVFSLSPEKKVGALIPASIPFLNILSYRSDPCSRGKRHQVQRPPSHHHVRWSISRCQQNRDRRHMMSADAAAMGTGDDAAAPAGGGGARTPSPRAGDRTPAGTPSVVAGTPGATSASSGTPRADLLESIERLKQEQRDLKAQRKRVVKDLKNAERKRKRLRQRARQLSDTDLIEVIQMRQASASSTDPAPTSDEKDGKKAPKEGGKGAKTDGDASAPTESESDLP